MKIIQEAIEAAATQDLCGNHNSADLLRRLARELEAERAGADAFASGLRIHQEGGIIMRSSVIHTAILAHAKRREAGE